MTAMEQALQLLRCEKKSLLPL